MKTFAAEKAKAEKRRGIEMSVAELAKFLGQQVGVVRRYIKEGMPTIGEGKPGPGKGHRVDSAQAIVWLIFRTLESHMRADAEAAGVETEKAARARKLSAQASREELRLSKEQGDVAPIDAFEKVLGEAITNARARLLSIPTKLAKQLENQAAPEIETLLRSEVHSALAELANATTARILAEANDEPMGPAT